MGFRISEPDVDFSGSFVVHVAGLTSGVRYFVALRDLTVRAGILDKAEVLMLSLPLTCPCP